MSEWGKEFLAVGSFAAENARGAGLLQQAQRNATAQGKSGTSAAQRPFEPSEQEKIRQEKAAKEFEALLLHTMIRTMWRTVPKEGVLGKSREEEYYQDMLSEALAENISENQSIGIKEVILREMISEHSSAQQAGEAASQEEEREVLQQSSNRYTGQYEKQIGNAEDASKDRK